jgi:hypothetical protein
MNAAALLLLPHFTTPITTISLLQEQEQEQAELELEAAKFLFLFFRNFF